MARQSWTFLEGSHAKKSEPEFPVVGVGWRLVEIRSSNQEVENGSRRFRQIHLMESLSYALNGRAGASQLYEVCPGYLRSDEAVEIVVEAGKTLPTSSAPLEEMPI